MSFLFSLFKLTLCLYNVMWVDTHVDVPLDADINKYVEIPQAYLYENGQMINHITPTYKRTGVNRTFISTVTTSYVKAYRIYYEVYFEQYNIRDVIQITFNVIDVTSPVITFIPEYTIEVDDPIPDLKKHLVYEDNYDDQKDLMIELNQSFIQKNTIGSYPIYYTIRDTSQNFRTYEVYIHIVDRKPPEISLIKPIIIDLNSHISVEEFFKIKDNYDLQVHINIDDQYVAYDQVGTYEIYVEVSDLSFNKNHKVFLVNVVDRIPPNLLLTSNPTPIDVYQTVTQDMLKSYVLSIYDNYDDIDIDDVEITHDIDPNRVGTYKVYYEVIDQSFNQTKQTLTIQVVDQIAPTIEIVKPFVFDVFSNPTSLYDYFIVSDNYCDIDDLKITITTQYKVNVVGEYDIKIEVIDSYKNKTTIIDKISIIDREPPKIMELSEIIITDFKKTDLSMFFRAVDGYDQSEDILLFVDDHQVDYDKIGDYEINVFATDKSGNMTMLASSVIVIDISKPTLELIYEIFYMHVFEEPLELTDFLYDVSDNYDNLQKGDVSIKGDIDYTLPGVYLITYTLKDSSLNSVEKTLKIYIYDREKPKIYAANLSLNMFDPLDLLEGVEVSDNIGVLNIYYSPTLIDTSIPGRYEVTYIVMDTSGNQSQFTRSIQINPIEDKFQIEQFIPMMIIMFVSLTVIYTLYKKM